MAFGAAERPAVRLTAVTGHFATHHAIAVQRIVVHLDFLDETIGALTEQINARAAAFDPVSSCRYPYQASRGE